MPDSCKRAQSGAELGNYSHYTVLAQVTLGWHKSLCGGRGDSVAICMILTVLWIINHYKNHILLEYIISVIKKVSDILA